MIVIPLSNMQSNAPSSHFFDSVTVEVELVVPKNRFFCPQKPLDDLTLQIDTCHVCSKEIAATVSKLSVGFVCVRSVTNNGQHQKLMTRQWQFKLHMRVAHSQIQRYKKIRAYMQTERLQLAEVNAQWLLPAVFFFWSSTHIPVCVQERVEAFIRYTCEWNGEILGDTGCLLSPHCWRTHTHTHSAGNASISSEYLCEVALATVIPSVSQLMLVKRQLNVNAQRSSIRIQNSDSFVGIIVSRFLVFDPYRQCQCQSASASTSARYRCPSHLKDLNCTAAAAFSIKNKLVPPKAKR